MTTTARTAPSGVPMPVIKDNDDRWRVVHGLRKLIDYIENDASKLEVAGSNEKDSILRAGYHRAALSLRMDVRDYQRIADYLAR